MKRKITLLFIIALVAGGMVGFAGDGIEASGNRCNPAGTWYAELSPPPYMAMITPIQGHSRYSVLFQGLYHASLWNREVMTDWGGEFVKSGDAYYGAAIALFGDEPGGPFPHWEPLETWGTKFIIWFGEDCDIMFLKTPAGGVIHAWTWDTGFPSVPPPIPWVDEPDHYPLGDVTPPGYAIYYRMALPTDYSVD